MLSSQLEIYRSFGNTREIAPAVRRIPLPSSDSLEMYDYQMPTFNKLKDEPYAVLRCPTGWGKTILMIFVAARFLRQHPDYKVIISVPKKDIAPGFVERKRCKIDGEILTWGTIHDMSRNAVGKKAIVKRFLSRTAGATPESRVIVTTHACLVSLLEEKGSIDLFHKTKTFIDECHHVQSEESELDLPDAFVMNRLGAFTALLLKQAGVEVFLATATFGRGDELDIIPASELNKFVFANVTFPEYWKNLKYLRTFQSCYVVYRDSPFIPFCELMLLSPKKTLIYCPRIGSRFLRNMTKDGFVAEVRRILLLKKGSYLWEPGNTAPNAIIDLTVDEKRYEKIQFFKSHGNDVFAIISVDMMKEGGDWPALEQVIDFAPLSKSATQRLQKFGRGTRDCIGKEHYSYYSFLPMIQSSQEDMRERLSENFGQLILGLVESAYFSPITEWDIPNGSGVRVRHPNLLARFGEDEQAKILSAARMRMIHLGAVAESDGFIPTTENIIAAVEDVLQTYEPDPSNRRIFAQQVVLYIDRQGKRIETQDDLESVNVVPMGFDKVDIADTVMTNAISFKSCVAGLETFSEIRTLMGEDENAVFFDMVDRLRNFDNPAVLWP